MRDTVFLLLCSNLLSFPFSFPLEPVLLDCMCLLILKTPKTYTKCEVFFLPKDVHRSILDLHATSDLRLRYNLLHLIQVVDDGVQVVRASRQGRISRPHEDDGVDACFCGGFGFCRAHVLAEGFIFFFDAVLGRSLAWGKGKKKKRATKAETWAVAFDEEVTKK